MATIHGKILECDRCVKRQFFKSADDPYMNSFYRINENDLCEDCAKDFEKSYAKFMSDKPFIDKTLENTLNPFVILEFVNFALFKVLTELEEKGYRNSEYLSKEEKAAKDALMSELQNRINSLGSNK